MEYTALYRKFRPKKFSEMVGQQHITRTLKNQIISERIGHAYLFSGGRGTGKTSSAKIFARAINCLNNQEGEPCNECEICKSMLDGSLTDIVEMDAASNNSVEDIRGIREEVNFLPTLAKYRIYIIDEVHMLSTGAFNALLKTLEEPPEHVKFILATTEPQKLPATILSRCQRFDFKKIPIDEIEKRLKIICNEINVEATDNALKLIAVLSEGAMRDSISILERCIQDDKNKISEEQIKELVGIPKLMYINKIVKNIVEYDIENAINTMNEIAEEGKDLNNFLWEIIKYIKDILVYKTSKKLEIYSEEEIKQIEELSEKITNERLLNIIYLLSNLENDMKYSSQKLIFFQTSILKACMKKETAGLEERIAILEEKIEKGTIVQNKIPKTSEKKVNNKKESTTINTNNLDYWPKIINKLKNSGKIMIYTNLLNTSAKQIDDSNLEIQFNNGITSFGKTVLTNPNNIEEIKKIILEETGKNMNIKFIEKNDEKIDNNVMSQLDSLGININIVE